MTILAWSETWTLLQEFYIFHDYSHYFYEDTIEPGFLTPAAKQMPLIWDLSAPLREVALAADRPLIRFFIKIQTALN